MGNKDHLLTQQAEFWLPHAVLGLQRDKQENVWWFRTCPDGWTESQNRTCLWQENTKMELLSSKHFKYKKKQEDK